jgi:hypothetical protein
MIRKANEKCPWYIPDSICDRVEAECKEAATPYVIGAAIAGFLLAWYLKNLTTERIPFV